MPGELQIDCVHTGKLKTVAVTVLLPDIPVAVTEPLSLTAIFAVGPSVICDDRVSGAWTSTRTRLVSTETPVSSTEQEAPMVMSTLPLGVRVPERLCALKSRATLASSPAHPVAELLTLKLTPSMSKSALSSTKVRHWLKS